MEIEQGEIIEEQRDGRVLEIEFNHAMILKDREPEPVPQAVSASTPATSTPPENNDSGLPTKWVAPETQLKIQAAIGALLALYVNYVTMNALVENDFYYMLIFIMFTAYVPVAMPLKWRESIRKHGIDTHNDCQPDGPIYEVNRDSFPRWRRVLNVKLST